MILLISLVIVSHQSFSAIIADANRKRKEQFTILSRVKT